MAYAPLLNYSGSNCSLPATSQDKMDPNWSMCRRTTHQSLLTSGCFSNHAPTPVEDDGGRQAQLQCFLFYAVKAQQREYRHGSAAAQMRDVERGRSNGPHWARRWAIQREREGHSRREATERVNESLCFAKPTTTTSSPRCCGWSASDFQASIAVGWPITHKPYSRCHSTRLFPAKLGLKVVAQQETLRGQILVEGGSDKLDDPGDESDSGVCATSLRGTAVEWRDLRECWRLPPPFNPLQALLQNCMRIS